MVGAKKFVFIFSQNYQFSKAKKKISMNFSKILQKQNFSLTSLSLSHHPSPFLTIPHHPSPSLTIPHHPLPSIIITHPLLINHHFSHPHPFKPHPSIFKKIMSVVCQLVGHGQYYCEHNTVNKSCNVF